MDVLELNKKGAWEAESGVLLATTASHCWVSAPAQQPRSTLPAVCFFFFVVCGNGEICKCVMCFVGDVCVIWCASMLWVPFSIFFIFCPVCDTVSEWILFVEFWCLLCVCVSLLGFVYVAICYDCCACAKSSKSHFFLYFRTWILKIFYVVALGAAVSLVVGCRSDSWQWDSWGDHNPQKKILCWLQKGLDSAKKKI